MKGFVIASRVRINQEGWTIINDLRFFRSLYEENHNAIRPFKLQSPNWTNRNNISTLLRITVFSELCWITSYRSAGSTFWASRQSASFSETLPHLNTQSYNSLQPAVPVCQWHTWKRNHSLPKHFIMLTLRVIHTDSHLNKLSMMYL